MTKKNANAALVYSFLYKIVQVRLSLETSVQIFTFYLCWCVINPPSLIEVLSSAYLYHIGWFKALLYRQNACQDVQIFFLNEYITF